MRTESKAMKFIKVQCNILDLNPKALYEQSKTLLLFYQHVIWAVKSRAVDLRKVFQSFLHLQAGFLDTLQVGPIDLQSHGCFHTR